MPVLTELIVSSLSASDLGRGGNVSKLLLCPISSHPKLSIWADVSFHCCHLFFFLNSLTWEGKAGRGPWLHPKRNPAAVFDSVFIRVFVHQASTWLPASTLTPGWISFDLVKNLWSKAGLCEGVESQRQAHGPCEIKTQYKFRTLTLTHPFLHLCSIINGKRSVCYGSGV